MLRVVVSIACMLLLPASVALADFYRYVDRDGREFFTNDLEKIPHEYRNSAAIVKPESSRVNVAEEGSASGRGQATIKEHKDKYGRGEAYWHKRADKLRKQLRALQDKYELVLEREKDAEAQPKKVSNKKGKSLTKAQLEKKIAQKKRELEVDLPEEARKAGAYPGWVRE